MENLGTLHFGESCYEENKQISTITYFQKQRIQFYYACFDIAVADGRDDYHFIDDRKDYGNCYGEGYGCAL